jgi:undecaprenyl-diphosphatase
MASPRTLSNRAVRTADPPKNSLSVAGAGLAPATDVRHHASVQHLTYPEAIVVGALQGVTELFPVSSLGHGVLLPALIGGSWATDLNMTGDKSPYLTFLVAVHVATAVALVAFFWRDWLRIIKGLYTSIRYRTLQEADQRLAWLLIVATVPVGLVGVLFDHLMRSVLGKPVPAAVFLTLNGVVLFAVEKMSRRNRTERVFAHEEPTPVGTPAGRRGAGSQVYAASSRVPEQLSDEQAENLRSDRRLAQLGWKETIFIGAAQILALFPGISRSGITMVAGMTRGLSHRDAARFAFLLATPVIAGAGVLKLPELAGPEGHGILGQTVVGFLVALVAAYISVRFLTRYFESRTLTPFAIYCFVAGLFCLGWFAIF